MVYSRAFWGIKMGMQEILAAKAKEQADYSLPDPADVTGDFPPPPNDMILKYPAGPKGSYRALELHQFFKSDGSRISPVNGVYEPADEEEKAMLKHYATMWNMVELQE